MWLADQAEGRDHWVEDPERVVFHVLDAGFVSVDSNWMRTIQMLES
jgi:hypothetical protein